MSLVRAALLLTQTAFNHAATRNPNAAPAKTRYALDTHSLLQLAPLIFKFQSPFFGLLALSEALVIVYIRLAHDPTAARLLPICNTSPSVPLFSLTPFFLFAAALSLSGAILRLVCYRALGKLFTFDLSMDPTHTLVTSGPYAIVRHPSYLGSLMLNFGLGLTFFSRASASLSVTCGWTAGAPQSLPLCIVLGLYWGYYLAVGKSRCKAEDAQLQTAFGKEWDEYAARVRWWYIPGLC